MAQRSLVAVANDKVSIVAVCRDIGMHIPDDIPLGRSVKLHCPFGSVYHIDHGVETAFRVYPDTNSAYCFAGCGYYSPVTLYAAASDVSRQEAAQLLLDSIGHKPLDLAAAWEHVQNPPEEVDQASLAEALKVFCSRLDPEWDQRQYEPRYAVPLTRCLDLLPRVRSGDDASKWLAATKTVMSSTLTQGVRA